MQSEKIIEFKNFKLANSLPFVLISGPCVIEWYDHAMMMAVEINKIAKKLKIQFIFKTSYDKANRTSIKSNRGSGLKVADMSYSPTTAPLQLHYSPNTAF